MYKIPSRRRKKDNSPKPNLVPIMDATFIFIFFLLFSASFIKIFEIPSDVPLVSDQEPPKDKKPLALTLIIDEAEISINTGVPSQKVASISRDSTTGFYNLEELRTKLIAIKLDNPAETSAIFEPNVDLTYEEIVKIMDAARVLKKTDPDIFSKDKDGISIKATTLFSRIIFSNIQS